MEYLHAKEAPSGRGWPPERTRRCTTVPAAWVPPDSSTISDSLTATGTPAIGPCCVTTEELEYASA